jgi:hypothetical protein
LFSPYFYAFSLYRDPQLRLGAWENPPKDIMNSTFFSKISWDAIYERRQDGPWLPDLPGFYRRSMYSLPSKSIADGEGSSHGNWNRIDFTSPPYHRMTEENQASEKLQQQNRKSEAVKKEENNGEEDEDEEEEEEDEIVDEEAEEELAVRDSIFISNQNEVPGWSYIDEEVLMSYITSLTEKKGEKKEKKKKVKKSDGESASASASASVNHNNTTLEPVTEETVEKLETAAEVATEKSDDVAVETPAVPVADGDDNIVKSESVETK